MAMVEQPLSVSGNMRKQLLHIGIEHHPVLIIDDFVANPALLVAMAETGPEFAPELPGFYPGARKLASAGYPLLLQQALGADLCALMGPPDHCRLHVDLAVYSLTSTPVKQLQPMQCVPHVDTHNPEHIAAVHYLCDEKFAGTSFYRHRSTGYESIDETRLKPYFAKLERELADQTETERNYMNGSTEIFERIAEIELKYNRLIVYRSNCLHAADISPSHLLSHSPRQGRLTLNSFLHLEGAKI